MQNEAGVGHFAYLDETVRYARAKNTSGESNQAERKAFEEKVNHTALGAEPSLKDMASCTTPGVLLISEVFFKIKLNYLWIL